MWECAYGAAFLVGQIVGVRNRRFGLFKTRAAKKELAGRDDARGQDDVHNQYDSHHVDSQFESQNEERDLTVEEPGAASDPQSDAPETAAKPKWPWQKQATAKNDSEHLSDDVSFESASTVNSQLQPNSQTGQHQHHTPVPPPKPEPIWWPRTILGWIALIIVIFVAVPAAYFWSLKYSNYRLYKDIVCEWLLSSTNGCIVIPPSSLVPVGPPILTQQNVLANWNTEMRSAYVLTQKFRALNVNYSNSGLSTLNTGNVLLGIYEREDPNSRPIEAGIHFLLAGSNGDYDARELYADLAMNAADRVRTETDLVELHKMNGRDGYFRLGQLYLGNDALDYNDPAFPTTPPRFLQHMPDFYNDFIVTSPDYSRAYASMQVAVLCNATEAIEWRRYIEGKGRLDRSQQESLRREAASELDLRGKQTDGGIEAYCEGRNLSERIELLVDPAVIWRFQSDRRPWPTFRQLVDKLKLPEYEFRQWIGLLVTEAVDLYGYDENAYYPRAQGGRSRYYYPYDSQGSEYYRNSPGADSTSQGAAGGNPPNRAAGRGGVDTRARDGLPAECVGMAPGEECVNRFDELECRSHATAVLNLGKAHLAAGNVRDARKNLQLANDEGRKCQAEAARQAARLLQALNLTCEYNANSLARISRDARDNPNGGAVIGLYARQRALRAHGHYDGNIDGKYGPMTRESVRRFQGDYGFDQTGDLTPIETVYLICSAAEIKSDAASMTTLGVMYLTGLGVVQNTDAGLSWLKTAEARGNILAKYNLSLIYGTGTVASSYKLCGVPENMQIADSWLEEAANLGHPRAQQLIQKYGRLLVSERWEKIKTELELDDFHRNRMSAVGEGCRPN